MMALALMAQAAPADPLARQYMRLTFEAYADCVSEQAKGLDDGHEAVQVVARAGITACDDRRGKAVMAAAMWAQIEQGQTVDMAARVATEIMTRRDKELTDSVTLQLLQARKAKRGQ